MMDVNRRNEIAFELVKAEARRSGISLDKNQTRREFGSLAKEMGIQFAEMLDFQAALVQDLLQEVVGDRKEPTEEELNGHDRPFHGRGH